MRDCERHGVAIFSELGGASGAGRVQRCRIYSNKLDGILVRDGAAPEVSGCDVRRNGGYGATLKVPRHFNRISIVINLGTRHCSLLQSSAFAWFVEWPA